MLAFTARLLLRSQLVGVVKRPLGMAAKVEEGFVIRVRGLPWSATEEKVIDFFGDDLKIVGGKEGVHLTLGRDGRPSGEAYLQLESDDDVERARKKHNCNMEHRYIEVFRSKLSEMQWVVQRAGNDSAAGGQDITPSVSEGCVRLRGLPFGCSKEEVANFFSGLEIVANGITLPKDSTGRASGEAYVQFTSKDAADKAVLKNKERIGHRYIEIFRSSLSEVRHMHAVTAGIGGGGRIRPLMATSGRPTPYDRGDRWGGGGGGGGRFPPMRGGRRGGFNGDFDDYYDGPPHPHHPPAAHWQRGGGGGRGRGGPHPHHHHHMPHGRYRGGGGGPGEDMMMDSWGGGGGGGGKQWRSVTGHTVHMRGLPYRSPESDILEFFAPLRPVSVHMLFDDMGRPSGQANVDFSSHDHAVKAMQKDKCHLGHRYIELFLNSTPDGSGTGGGGGGISGGADYDTDTTANDATSAAAAAATASAPGYSTMNAAGGGVSAGAGEFGDYSQDAAGAGGYNTSAYGGDGGGVWAGDSGMYGGGGAAAAAGGGGYNGGGAAGGGAGDAANYSSFM